MTHEKEKEETFGRGKKEGFENQGPHLIIGVLSNFSKTGRRKGQNKG